MPTPLERLTGKVTGGEQTAEQKDQAVKSFNMPTLQWLISGLAAVVLGICGILNWQFFTQASPGALGILIGFLALASGVAAFACWHTISHSAGKFHVAVIVSALILSVVDILHASIQYYKNTNMLTQAWPDIQRYAQFGALPVLLIELVGVGFALAITHWRHNINVEKAKAATEIQTSEARLQTAEVKMDNEERLDQRRLKHLDNQLAIQKQTIQRIKLFAENHQEMRAELAKITDPRMRAELEQMFSTVASIEAFETPKDAKPTSGYVNGRAEQHPNS